MLIRGSGRMAAAVDRRIPARRIRAITHLGAQRRAGARPRRPLRCGVHADAGPRPTCSSTSPRSGWRARMRTRSRSRSVDPGRDQGVRRGRAPRRDAADPRRARPRACRSSPAPRCTRCRPPVSSSATPAWRSPRIRWLGRAHSREGNDLSHSHGNATRKRDTGTRGSRGYGFVPQPLPGKKWRSKEFHGPARSTARRRHRLRRATDPRQDRVSAQAATAVTGSATQVASGHQSSSDPGSQPLPDHLRDAVLPHRDAVEGVRDLHRALLVRDDDELRRVAERPEDRRAGARGSRRRAPPPPRRGCRTGSAAP